MTTAQPDWEERITSLWATMDDHEPGDFLSKMQALTSELSPDDAIGMFELASANDSTGHEEQAASLYQRAIAAGLTGLRRRRAVIQLASTLRNLGRPQDSVSLLRIEQKAASDELDDAVIAFMALALVDMKKEKEAVAIAVSALSRHLTRYNRSLENYAKELSEGLD
ncbi:MAG: tetratricopeptide repeat protein [Candidatus Eremiobacteraeota bacterium]|nr:tetratricopeptide repeat protein [Candidatus Eremiobacteraeota bacterium]